MPSSIRRLAPTQVVLVLQGTCSSTLGLADAQQFP